VRGSVLQLRKDLVQPWRWSLRGQQHRQVQQPLGVWRPSQLRIRRCQPPAQRRIGEMVTQQGNRPAAKRPADRGGERRKPHPAANRPPIVHPKDHRAFLDLLEGAAALVVPLTEARRTSRLSAWASVPPMKAGRSTRDQDA
jgi:hypothetical protein